MSTTTSNAEAEAHRAEARRLRLERLLQCTGRDFELRFAFGDGDRLGRRRIQAGAEAPGQGAFLPLKAGALHLFGHYRAESEAVLRQAREEEASGKPRFAALWHALENARVENRLIDRWPGMRTAFAARLLPNLGGSLVRVLSRLDQVRLGLYLEGRGLHGAQYAEAVALALGAAALDIRSGADGQTPWDSLEAVRRLYPALAALLRLAPGTAAAPPDPEDEDRGERSGPDEAGGAPELEIDEGLFEVSLSGLRRELPEWYRPGSAPWFERGLGQKKIHPSAWRPDRQTVVPPPAGDLNAYRSLWSEVEREVGFLARRMTNLLREDSYLRYGGQFRSGKLHTAKLYKQRLGNYRLFERPAAGERSVVFQLLVDESASMRGQDKVRTATKAALLLGETLHSMSVPLEIIGFTTSDFEARAAMVLGLRPAHAFRTTRCSPLEHRIYKRFDEPFPLVRRRLTGIEARHNNWDEEHLRFAHRRLQARRERTKVMIVISDGQPNGDADFLIATLRDLEALGCRIIGVGIGADFVRQAYRRSLVVHDFRSMAGELLALLADELGRARRAEVPSGGAAGWAA